MTQSTEQERARVLFNPYTGERRHISDVQSDPQGLLIVAPGAELQSARSAQVVPQGWRLVPDEPTLSMQQAALKHVNKQYQTRYVYAAMLAAAPKPQEK